MDPLFLCGLSSNEWYIMFGFSWRLSVGLLCRGCVVTGERAFLCFDPATGVWQRGGHGEHQLAAHPAPPNAPLVSWSHPSVVSRRGDHLLLLDTRVLTTDARLLSLAFIGVRARWICLGNGGQSSRARRPKHGRP